MNKQSSILLSIVLIITGFGTLVLGNYLVFAIAISTNPDWDGARAVGTLTFSGNVSNGELVNITNGENVYRFEFNTTGNGSNTATVLTTNAIRINLSMEANLLNVRNTSVLASGNLTAAINANISTSALVTAVNTTNVTTITTTAIGSDQNLIATSENGVNIAWSSATLKGGKIAVAGQSATLNYATIVFPLFGITLMLIGVLSLMAAVRGFALSSGKGFTPSNNKTISESNNSSERSSSLSDERG